MLRFFVVIASTIVSIAATGVAVALDGVASPERMAVMSKSHLEKIAQNRSETLPPPRDPDIAVREEFDMARAQNTAQAWELFIARHGDHRLAAEARKELQKLTQTKAR